MKALNITLDNNYIDFVEYIYSKIEPIQIMPVYIDDTTMVSKLYKITNNLFTVTVYTSLNKYIHQEIYTNLVDAIEQQEMFQHFFVAELLNKYPLEEIMQILNR